MSRSPLTAAACYDECQVDHLNPPPDYSRTPHSRAPQANYPETLEEYYSESDCISENQPAHQRLYNPRRKIAAPSDVRELYRRKHSALVPLLPVTEHGYTRHLQPCQPEYCYEVPEGTMRTTPVCSYSLPRVDPRTYYAVRAAATEPEPTYEYRSQSHIARGLRLASCSMMSGTPKRTRRVRRYPVTVRTPRYYRPSVPSSTNLCKRPSALCLPIASQPDPAFISLPGTMSKSIRSTSKRSQVKSIQPLYDSELPDCYATAEDQPTPLHDYGHVTAGGFCRRCGSKSANIHKMDSEGDMAKTMRTLQDMLNKIGRRQGRLDQETMDEVTASSGDDMRKVAQYLKPRLPPSLKNRATTSTMSYEAAEAAANGGAGNTATLSVEAVTPEVMDILLDKLNKDSKRGQKATEMLQQQIKELNKRNSQHSFESIADNETKEEDKQDVDEQKKTSASMTSYTYQELSRQLLHQQSNEVYQKILQEVGEQAELLEYKERERTSTIEEKTSAAAGDRELDLEVTYRAEQQEEMGEDEGEGEDSVTELLESPKQRGQSQKSMSMGGQKVLDDHTALELHRSKSYIVNLIDRALSKELGTVPAEKCVRHQFEHMTTKKAIETVHRCSKIGVEMELSETPTQSIASHASSADQKFIEPQASQLCDSGLAADEKTTKQLMQLRWNYIREIQCSARRLEDLVRFLDSYAPTASQGELWNCPPT